MRLRLNPGLSVLALLLITPGHSAAHPADDPRFDPALRVILASPGAIVRPRLPGSAPAPARLARTSVPLEEALPGHPIPALLSYAGSSPDWKALGFTVLGEVSGAAAVLGTFEAFERLSRWPGLGFARLSRPVQPSLDQGLAAVNGSEIRHGVPPAYSGPTGKGAIVAIVDTGVDIFHADFRHEDGSSRVVAMWDQYAPGSSAEVPVGQVYREAEIANYISDRWLKPGGFDRVGHGTHVAGIAAGDGSESGLGVAYRYVGVAPEADIIVVRTGFDEASVVAALFFVFEEAARRGKPVAVNLSLGNQYGPHDGTDPFEKIVSDLCGPGRQVVVSAGNQGNEGIHAFLPAGAGADSVSFHLPPYPTAGDLLHVLHLEGWTRGHASFSATVVLPGGRRIGPIRGGPDEFESTNHVLRIGTGETDQADYFFIEGLFYGAPRMSGEWTIVIEPDAPEPRAAMNFWIPLADFNGGYPPHFQRGFDPRTTLSPPANGQNVIAATALVSKICWVRQGGTNQTCFVTDRDEGDLAEFSSVGPTADGRPKPEAATPGFGVVSALSSSMTTDNAAAFELPVYLDPDGVHWLQTGTSMSAPFATGALALLMARVPDLTPAEAQARFMTGTPVETAGGPPSGHRLNLNEFASPIAQNGLFEGELLADLRVRLSWTPIPLRGEPLYRLSRALDGGGFEIIPGTDRRGRGPHEFIDRPLEPGRTARYRLLAVDASGVHETVGSIEVEGTGSPRLTLRIPTDNPGPPPMRFSFYLPPTDVTRSYRLRLFDILGRPVRTLVDGVQVSEGQELSAVWDGRLDGGNDAASGIYLARLDWGGDLRTVKVVLRRS